MQTERYESSFGCKHRQQKLAHHKMKVKAQMAIKKGHSQKMTPMVHTVELSDRAKVGLGTSNLDGQT